MNYLRPLLWLPSSSQDVYLMMPQESASLPREPVDRLTGPLSRFVQVEAASGAVLLIATVAALVLSNTAWSAPFMALWRTPIGLRLGSVDYVHSLSDWINQCLMTLFFFVIALELKREIALGELRRIRVAAFSLSAAVGGMLVPAAMYLLWMSGRAGVHGWGTVMATDTAFVIGCLALLGPRLPATLRLFLLSMAIFDDVGAILVVAFGYGHAMHWLALAGGVAGIVIIAGAARLGIKSIPVYFLLGVLTWACVDASGLHPTLVGVILGLMTPARAWVSDERMRSILARLLANRSGGSWSGDTESRRDLRRAGSAVSEALSPVERLEIMLHPWVSFAIVPVFALANAGVDISGADYWKPVSTVILVTLVLGKPIGVMSFTWLAVRLGLAERSPGLSWPLLAAGSLLTGIGFTMSLLIAGQAYAPDMLNAAKSGILAGSAVSAALGLLALGVIVYRNRRNRGQSGLPRHRRSARDDRPGQEHMASRHLRRPHLAGP